MKQFPRLCLSSAALLLIFLTAACAPSRPAELASDEVLRRTVFTHQQLESVAFDASALFRVIKDSESSSGSVIASGVLRGASGAWSADAVLSVERAEDPSLSAVRTLAFALTQPVPGQTYLRLDSVHGTPSALSGITLSEWRRLAGDQPLEPLAVSTTPDPTLAGRLAAAINVESGGLVLEAGRWIYHYSVLVPGQVATPLLPVTHLRGEVWIDAVAFRLVRADWAIQASEGQNRVRGSLSISFRDFNRTQPVLLPIGSGSDLELKALYDMF